MGNAASHMKREHEYVVKMTEFLKNPRTFMIDSRDTHGDVFLYQSALVHQKVAGITGPEALEHFEAKLLDGTLVKAGALPSGIQALVGPIVISLDGQEHQTRKAAMMKAFTAPQLAKYAPVIRRIVQTEHLRWAARGGALTIVLLTEQLIFKVMLAVLYGLEGEYDEYRIMVDDFVSSIRKSASAPSSVGLEARDTFVQDIIVPAIAEAKQRVETDTMKPCVFDCLVALKELSDDELRAEGFHMMFAGFGGVSCLAANLLTPLVTLPDIRDAVIAARDDFFGKFGEEKWDHLEDLGYLNNYILEVKRTFVAGPTQVYAKATTEFEIKTSVGTFHIPKGCLVAAGLETTNLDPEVHFSPNEFNPTRFETLNAPHAYAFCPHGVGTSATRRCAGESLTTLILQIYLVSCFDYTWNMVPGQDYTLETHSSTPTPVGGLKVVGFQKRMDGSSYGVAGSADDAVFLTLPEAKSLIGNQTAGLYSDPRMDLWTTLMIKLIGKKQAAWNRPYADTALLLPKEQVPLQKITLAQTHIQIPVVDEDWPTQSWREVKQSNFLRDHAPFHDDFVHKFHRGEDGERYVMSKVGHMWPRVNVHWNDRYSDRALELLVFNGLGSHLVQKLPLEQDDGSYYGLLLNFMQALEVRPGFAKYGADAFFDKNGKVVKIQRGDRTYTKKDPEWEYVKMCFRGSLQTKVTAVDHLLGIHITVANYLVTSSREQLPTAHPLRRLTKPFTFRTVSINFGAGRALFWPKGMLQRAYALSAAGMKQTWEYGLKAFTYCTFPNRIAKQNIDTLKLPFHEDGLDYWTIVLRFVQGYIDLYYQDDAAVVADKDIQNFWNFILSVSPAPLPALAKQALVDFIAHCIFLVSSMHNHLGTIAEYVSDPAFCPSAWAEGEYSAPPGNAVRLALIMTATGFTQPAITEDFSHVMLDNAAKALVHRFSQDCFDLIKVIDERNTKRVQPFQSFNPKTMEMAVSI